MSLRHIRPRLRSGGLGAPDLVDRPRKRRRAGYAEDLLGGAVPGEDLALPVDRNDSQRHALDDVLAEATRMPAHQILGMNVGDDRSHEVAAQARDR